MAQITQLLTVDDLMGQLGLKNRTACIRMVKKEKIPYYTIGKGLSGGSMRFKLEDIEKWLNSKLVRGCEISNKTKNIIRDKMVTATKSPNAKRKGI